MQIKPIILSTVFLLAGCINQSQIQAKYGKSKNICRLETGRLFASSDSLGNSVDAQAAVNNSFNECMTKAGWRTPKPQQVAQTQNPPSGSPSTNPSAAASRQRPVENPQAAAQPQQQVAQPQPQQVAQTQNPPSGAPSTNPSAAAARPASAAQAAPAQASPLAAAQPVNALRERNSPTAFALPGAQPARPPTVPAAPYGSVARKF